MLIGFWKGVAVGIGVAVGVRVDVGVAVEVSVGVGIVAVGVGGTTGAGRQPASKISKSTTKSVCLIFFKKVPGFKKSFGYSYFLDCARILAERLNFVQAVSFKNLPIGFVSGIACTRSNHSSSARAA
jgi:hypothetical protein